MSAEIVLGECPECGTHIYAPAGGCGDGDVLDCPGCSIVLAVRMEVALVQVLGGDDSGDDEVEP